MLGFNFRTLFNRLSSIKDNKVPSVIGLPMGLYIYYQMYNGKSKNNTIIHNVAERSTPLLLIKSLSK